MPSGNKPLPEPMLTQLSVTIWCYKATMSWYLKCYKISYNLISQFDKMSANVSKVYSKYLMAKRKMIKIISDFIVRVSSFPADGLALSDINFRTYMCMFECVFCVCACMCVSIQNFKVNIHCRVVPLKTWLIFSKIFMGQLHYVCCEFKLRLTHRLLPQGIWMKY